METALNRYQIDAISIDEFDPSRLEYLALAGSGIPIEFGIPPVTVADRVRFDLAPVFVPDWVTARSLRQMLNRVPFTPEMLVASYIDDGLSNLLYRLVQLARNPLTSNTFAGTKFTFTTEDISVIQRSFLTSCLRDPRLKEGEIIAPLHPLTKAAIEQEAAELTKIGQEPITSFELASWMSYNFDGPLSHFPSLISNPQNVIPLRGFKYSLKPSGQL